MSECNKCNGTLFVCENHPDQEAHQCKHCGGAGMPCECTEPVSEWISVKDRLPEPLLKVLVCDINNSISISYRFITHLNKPVWCLSPFYGNVSGYFTHWMPLPNPPKKVV